MDEIRLWPLLLEPLWAIGARAAQLCGGCNYPLTRAEIKEFHFLPVSQASTAFHAFRECVAAVLRMEDLTRCFVEATTFRLDADKSVRFATTARVRRMLGDRLGFPVVASFRDLGVDQQLGSRRDVGELERRLQAAKLLRFVRCSRPAWPWDARVRVCAAACVSAAAYAAGAA